MYVTQQSPGKDAKIARESRRLGHVNDPCSSKFHWALNNWDFPRRLPTSKHTTRTNPQDLVPFARTAHSSQHASGW